jgi:hypothetical protein
MQSGGESVSPRPVQGVPEDGHRYGGAEQQQSERPREFLQSGFHGFTFGNGEPMARSMSARDFM